MDPVIGVITLGAVSLANSIRSGFNNLLRTDRRGEIDHKLQRERLEFEANKLKFQEMQRLNNLASQQQEQVKNREHQAHLSKLNRDLQWELAEYNQRLQTRQGQLNRELQRELSSLNREFQAKEGCLNREHAARLERFRAEVQKWAVEQQIDLQLKKLEFDREERAKDREHQAHLSKLNRDLQWELAEYNQRLQTHQGQLNRELQRELSALNREFQAKEGWLNREHAARLERFRAEVQKWAVEQQIDLQLKRIEFDRQERAKDRASQGELAELNRELQKELQRWNQQFQADEAQLSRQLQRELAALNHDFQAEQGRLNREHALRLERFRTQVQRWALEQKRNLQLELKRLDAELARELRDIDRKNALAKLREQRRLSHLPLYLQSEQILTTDYKQPLPLRIFFSPPNLRFGESANPVHVVKDFPHLEDALAEQAIGGGIRQLSGQYSAHGRPIEFIGGGWKGESPQRIRYEAAARAVFAELKTEPVLILDSELIRFNFHLHVAFWASNWSNPRYRSMTSLSWREMLYHFVRLRTKQWKKKALGKSKEQLAYLYGEETYKKNLHNLNTMGRERHAIAKGIDPQLIERNYHLDEQDYENLTHFINTCHAFSAGLLADEYFLRHVPRTVRQRPLLPTLLLNLLKGMPAEVQQEFTAVMANFYQALCKALSEEESTWMPEIRLDMALSLAELPDKSWAKQQIAHSIRSWMALRGMKPVEMPENGNISLDILIDTMGGGLMTMSDHEYLAKLDECLSALYR